MNRSSRDRQSHSAPHWVIRYTHGSFALAAVAALALEATGSALLAGVGGVLIAGAVVLLLVVERLRGRDPVTPDRVRTLALVLATTVVVATALVLALAISVTFWEVPRSWAAIARDR
jgi:hypothetical protein